MKKALALTLALLFLTSCTVATVPAEPETSTSFTLPVKTQQMVEDTNFITDLTLQKLDVFAFAGLNDYEIALALYDDIIESIYFADPVGLDIWRYKSPQTIPPAYLENRALSPLLYEIGSCEDFAAYLTLLLINQGIEAKYIAGYTISVDGDYIDHAWVMAKIYGNWYHLDPQLEQNVVKKSILDYRYFLKTDEEMFSDHKWGQNLISHFERITSLEAEIVLKYYTPPAASTVFQKLEPREVVLPKKPDFSEVLATIASEKKKILPDIFLNVEPPILIADMHITPALINLADLRQNIYQHGRETLEEAEQAQYDAIYAAAISGDYSAQININASISNESLVKILNYFSYDNPALYFLEAYEKTENGRFFIEFYINDKSASEKAEALEKHIKGITYQLFGSEYDILMNIHDFLATKIEYDRSVAEGSGGNAYTGIVENFGVCDSYSKSFHYILQTLGYEAIYFVGESTWGRSHSWNAAKIAGEWQYFDITWDRPEIGDAAYHDYFAVTLAEIKIEHVFSKNIYPPVESTATHDFYLRESFAALINVDEEIEAAIISAFFNALTAYKTEPTNGWARIFLEIKVFSDKRKYQLAKAYFMQNPFNIQRALEERIISENIDIALQYDEALTCDTNDALQVFTMIVNVKINNEDMR